MFHRFFIYVEQMYLDTVHLIYIYELTILNEGIILRRI